MGGEFSFTDQPGNHSYKDFLCIRLDAQIFHQFMLQSFFIGSCTVFTQVNILNLNSALAALWVSSEVLLAGWRVSVRTKIQLQKFEKCKKSFLAQFCICKRFAIWRIFSRQFSNFNLQQNILFVIPFKACKSILTSHVKFEYKARTNLPTLVEILNGRFSF